MWNIMIVVVVVIIIIIIIIIIVVVVVVVVVVIVIIITNIPSVINGNTVEENEEEDDEEERDGKARLEIPAWLGTLNENWQYSNNGTHVGDKIAFGNCLASMTRSISLLEWTPCLETGSLRGSQQQTTPSLTLPPQPPINPWGSPPPSNWWPHLFFGLSPTLAPESRCRYRHFKFPSWPAICESPSPRTPSISFRADDQSGRLTFNQSINRCSPAKRTATGRSCTWEVF